MKLKLFVFVLVLILSSCGSIDPMNKQFTEILYYQDSTQGNNILANRIFRNCTYHREVNMKNYYPISTNEFNFMTTKSLLFLRNNLVYMTTFEFPDSFTFASFANSRWITDRVDGWGVYQIRKDSVFAQIYWRFSTLTKSDRDLCKLVNFCGVIADSNQIINWQLCAPFPKLTKVNQERVDQLITPLQLKATNLAYMKTVDPNKIWFNKQPKTR